MWIWDADFKQLINVKNGNYFELKTKPTGITLLLFHAGENHFTLDEYPENFEEGGYSVREEINRIATQLVVSGDIILK